MEPEYTLREGSMRPCKAPEHRRTPKRFRAEGAFPICLRRWVVLKSSRVRLFAKLKAFFGRKVEPEHLRRGRLGERAAQQHLQAQGLKFLTANFRSEHGEIDLVFRDDDCLVFIEVKARSSEEWARPAAAVDARKRRLLSLTAEDYLRKLADRRVKWRFDVVEVLLAQGEVREVRQIINAFVADTRRPRKR